MAEPDDGPRMTVCDDRCASHFGKCCQSSLRRTICTRKSHLLSNGGNCMSIPYTTSKIRGPHYTEYIPNYMFRLQIVQPFSFTAVSDETL